MIDRREFLSAMAQMGAAVILTPDSSDQVVDDIWSQMLANPWMFDVSEHGVISDPAQIEPKLRGDVWRIDTKAIRSAADLIGEVQSVYPLTLKLQWLAEDHREELASDLEQARESVRIAQLQQQIDAIDALGEEGWEEVVKAASDQELAGYVRAVEDWLQEPVDFDEQEWFPRDFGARGAVYAFFCGTAAGIAADLGVTLVEGDHPGSSYFGAELRGSIDDANDAAASLDLPFRFRAV